MDQADYDQFVEAKRAADRGNYARAVEIFEALAEQGNSDAFVNLARFYTLGHGVPVALDKAEKLSEHAIALGNPAGHLQLASVWHRRGDMTRYLSDIRQAAEKGSLVGQSYLARCYAFCRGVEADADKALELMRELAGRGSSMASSSSHLPPSKAWSSL
jgi:uncharacterized protein